MMEKDWFDSLKDRMESYEESTPEGLWDSISSAVDKQRKKRSSVILPWVWRTAVAAAVVAIGVFAAGLLSDDTTQNQIKHNQIIDDSVALQGRQTDPSNVPNPSSVYSEEVGDPASECAIVSQSGGKRLMAQAETIESTDHGRDVQSTSVSQSLAEDEAGAPVVIEQGPVEPQKSEPLADIYIPDNVSNHDDEDWSDRMSIGEKNRRTAFISPASVETSFSGAVTDSKDVGVFDPKSFYRGSAPSGSTSADEETTGGTSDNGAQKVSINNLPSVTNTTKHYRPIRAAVTARWKFGSVFGIETGAEWTLLHSKFSTSSGNTVNETLQTLQYVGVPLNLTADLFNTNRFTLYLSTGALAEKCISAKKQEKVLVSGDAIQSQTSTFVVDPILYSLNASAGAQVRVLGNFGLYFEPGVSYHFNDGSDVETIYKERPFDFVMTFGLRYSFK